MEALRTYCTNTKCAKCNFYIAGAKPLFCGFCGLNIYTNQPAESIPVLTEKQAFSSVSEDFAEIVDNGNEPSDLDGVGAEIDYSSNSNQLLTTAENTVEATKTSVPNHKKKRGRPSKSKTKSTSMPDWFVRESSSTKRRK